MKVGDKFYCPKFTDYFILMEELDVNDNNLKQFYIMWHKDKYDFSVKKVHDYLLSTEVKEMRYDVHSIFQFETEHELLILKMKHD